MGWDDTPVEPSHDEYTWKSSFATKDSPDQVYRLWTPLFLHAGLIHLTITWLIHWYLMRDLERLCGPIRMAIIYIGSGIMGNAASAVFVPHRAESGPAGKCVQFYTG